MAEEGKRLGTGTIVMASMLTLSFLVTLAILFTDKNLQNDFGIYTGSGYFIHWYGLLITGIVDVIGAGLIFVKPSRLFLRLGTVWTGFMTAFTIGDVFLYSEVGFTGSNGLSQFASYLFGLSKFPGSESYIPGLYDVLVAIYALTFVLSIVSMAVHRNKS